MKKFLLATVIGAILLLSGMEAMAAVTTQNTPTVTPTDTGNDNRDFTHTVFAEDATATWCGYCHYAREALDAVYTSHDYPFFYVCLVDDKDTHSASRVTEYNTYGFPTVFFDYGYNVQVGGYTGNENDYRVAIQQCGARSVADIDVGLNVQWLGDATMDISVSVKNNEAAPYAGKLRVYVTEVQSSMGWVDTSGHPYTFPFLDYAFNEPITMATGDTFEDSITWDGHNYNDGYGHNFGNLQYGNVAVIAAVFNNTLNQGYAYPPSSNPFNAYYVDDCAGFIVGGTGPYPPSSPDPKDGATGVDINKILSWTGGGSPGSTITYDVYFGTTNPPSIVSHNQSSTTYNPGTLNYETTYYWKIVAWDQDQNTAEGQIWHFATSVNPNHPPSTPTITGPAKGKPGTTYKFTISATDPDTVDTLYAFVDWGDNTTSGWVGPFDSGETFAINHAWAEKGTFNVRAKVKDDHGAESDWATLSVKMPYGTPYPLLHWLFDQFPNAFPLLRYLFGE
jgi:glutaredoxin